MWVAGEDVPWSVLQDKTITSMTVERNPDKLWLEVDGQYYLLYSSLDPEDSSHIESIVGSVVGAIGSQIISADVFPPSKYGSREYYLVTLDGTLVIYWPGEVSFIRVAGIGE